MTDPAIPLDSGGGDIAIVGMAAHLPDARSLAEYWANLRDGVESIRRLTEEELLAAGERPEKLRHRNYVPAASILEGFEEFDADFFGFSPKEAAIMDPQHRQFLEVAWEALENAGHMPESFPGPIGVFAGCGMGSYFYFNLCSNPDLVDSVGMFLLRHTGNDKDFLATRVSHVLDLKGPSINLQTACSTSLVAVHYACRALLSGECDMALAGGVTIELPHRRGYVHEEGEILSPDGHCHAFDHRAQGTVFGSGAGVVALRRLQDALADGDHIWAVIKGSAVNNDGAAKAGYLAPSVEGQAAAVAAAHAAAGVGAGTIGYVECHGTGTYLGDPIEVAALTQAFRATTGETGFCRIGSVKTNIGHLDTAAGVASLIKVALALHHRQLPPSLGYEAPNPAIDFAASPFEVNAALCDWQPPRQGPRRAGVNSLGVGGTNAHAVLEEAPERPASEPSDWPFQLLVLSGRSRAALDANAAALAAHLRAHPEQPLADIAWTLRQGRRAFQKRRVLVAASHEEAAALLEGNDPQRVFTHEPAGDPPEVVFMFPGGGAQYAGMARDLYETEPVFREWMDRGLEALQPKLDYDIRALWLPGPGEEAAAAERLKRPSVQLPLIMICEYALAQLWISWGVSPAALVGHSMGENTAACLAGVMSFEDCIGLVHLRGQLFDTVPAGGMLSVPMAAEELRPLLGEALDLASVNAPGLCVVSGPQAALDALAARLAAAGTDCTRIAIDIAAHSRMLEPVLARFGAYLRAIRLSPPQIPFVSNRSGDWITAQEATDPDYWVGHLRNAVNFADCMATLAARPERVYLEVGPGKALASLAQANGVPAQQVMSSLRHPEQRIADDVHFIGVLGRLWATGVPVDWEPIWGMARRNRVPLPGYAFQRQPYFIAPGAARAAARREGPARAADPADWGWVPVWRPRLPDLALDAGGPVPAAPCTWLVFLDEAGLGMRLAARLREAGHRVVEVRAGDAFARTGEAAYTLSPERGREGYSLLLQDLVARGLTPARIAHFWLVTRDETFRPGSSFFHRNQEQGFYSLMFLAQALGEENLPRPIHLTVVTSGAAQLPGEDLPFPEKATVLGPVRVIPRELPGVTCAALDVVLPRPGARLFGGRIGRALTDPFAGRRAMDAAMGRLADQVLEDLLAAPPAPGSAAVSAAWRGERRFELEFRPRRLDSGAGGAGLEALRDGGVCLITGGFGGIGLTIAERLIRERGARVALLARTTLPRRETWRAWLREHDPHDPVSRRIRAVRQLEEIGGEVMVLAADVCNLDEMREAVVRVRARLGGLHAVIHAAGMVDDAPLMAKTSAGVEEVMAPKIHGTQVLDSLFPDGTLDLMVLFSSTSTVTAPAGQIDYVAANEYLNAYAGSRRGGRTRVLAIDWGIWNEVGMAADAVSARLGQRPKPPSRPAGQPLLDTATFDARGNRLFTTRLAVAERWVLDGHRTRSGEALLPGTASLELAAEALAAQGEHGPFEIRDLYFFRPFHVAADRPREMRVRLARSDEGYAFELRGECLLNGRRGFELCAQAGLALGQGEAAPGPIDPAAIRARCRARSLPEDRSGHRSPQEEHLDFGPRWRVLRTMDFGAGEGIARLALPGPYRGEPEAGWLLHPALLDLATGWAMELIAGYRPAHLWVPVSYRRVRVLRPLPAEIVSWVRNAAENRAEAPVATFDVTLADPQGNVCLEVEGFSIRRLDSAEGFARAAAPDPRAVEFDEEPGAAAGDLRPLSAAEERLMRNLAQGIGPAEGAEAFGRALATGLPQVVVSSLDLPALVAQAGDSVAAAEEGGGQKFQRPKLDSDYVAPRNDIERTLVGFWEELLGVDQVGVEDSFFDLGGHSLIAVRLFAMIKKAWRTEFPISVLFEAPTIARCAALIEARIGPSGAGAEEPPGPAAARPAPAPARRFTHLVAMHEGEGGPGRPFFLVAGMFGNVLNLRHLAHLLGANRPFYGLQARGLYGDQAPHATLAEAAADYIAELRQVQPRGPYLLGGFSGGGLTAYEMARQLEAAGEKVALLVLLDTPLPVPPPLGRADRLRIKAQEIRRGGLRYFGQWARDRLAWEIGRLRARFEEAPALPETQFHNAEIEAAFRAALPVYDLQPWDGPVVLFRPPLDRRWKVGGGRWVNSERDYVFEDNDWTRFVRGLQVVEVPGNHDSMVLEPNVRVLAARMRGFIERAEAGDQPCAEAAE